MRNVRFDLCSNTFQVARHHSNSGRSVDVVVTINQNAFFILDGLMQAIDRLAHVFHEQWMVQRCEARI